MTLDEKLQRKMYKEIWQEYCGFLDLSMEEYMEIQNRLMMEQIHLYAGCRLGQRFFGGEAPRSVEEYRRKVPLTRYEDYADVLLKRDESALPAKSVIWIETTWEGGRNPIKLAPYTQSMVENHRGTILSCMLLATSDRRGSFRLRKGDKFLFGMAPLPYFTGIIPYALQGQLTVDFMPPVSNAVQMSFGQRNKEGLKQGMQHGIDIFFGMSSVIARISEMFGETMKGGGGTSGGKLKMLMKNSPKMNWKIIRAMHRCKEEGVELQPKDIWSPKGLMCGGTDSSCFKKKIEKYWGVRPMEIFGGTEPTCIGTETWSRDGMVLFPDICFYEFIPEQEMLRSLEDPSYQPHTYLMNELVAGENYEIVISSFKGGAFVRYRVGDVFRCVRLKNAADGIGYPQFAYVDRIPTVIDIAGFTRITENTIAETIRISNLQIHNWFAVKEFDYEDRAYMNLYVEMSETAVARGAVAKEIIQEHLSIYFRYVDSDYQDLKKMLGIDPLVITMLPTGTIERYEAESGKKIRKMNPSHYDVAEINRMLRE